MWWTAGSYPFSLFFYLISLSFHSPSDLDNRRGPSARDPVEAAAASGADWGASHCPQHHRWTHPRCVGLVWALEEDDHSAAGWDAQWVSFTFCCVLSLWYVTYYWFFCTKSLTRFFFIFLCRDFNLKEALEGISAQICCELNKSLTERNYPPLTPALQGTLKGQICSITEEDNPIRTLVGKSEKNDLNIHGF